MRKTNQNHRTSVTAGQQRPRVGFRQRVMLEKLASLSHQQSTSGGTLSPLCIWEWGQRRVLLLRGRLEGHKYTAT